MSIQDRLNQEPAPGWRPEVGDQIIGTILEISEAPGTEYGPYPLLTIAQDDGTEVAVHAFHTVLKKELAAKRPVEGDRIGIKYLGIPSGKRYESYRVVLERRTPTQGTNWDAVGAAADQELAGETAPATVPAGASWAEEDPF